METTEEWHPSQFVCITCGINLSLTTVTRDEVVTDRYLSCDYCGYKEVLPTSKVTRNYFPGLDIEIE